MLNRHTILQSFLLIIFGTLVACQPPALNQRIIQQPHSLYVDRFAPYHVRAPSDQQRPAKKSEEFDKIGLPSSCRSSNYQKQFCLECDNDPVPIKRCQSGIKTHFSTDKYCRHTATALKCLDRISKQSLVVLLRSNQDGRFLVQFDMILETLDIIFRNEITNDNELLQAKNVLNLVGESKIGLFQKDLLAVDPFQPKISRLLSHHSEQEKQVIIKKLKNGYADLQKLRLAGQLESRDAIEFLVELFEISQTDQKIIKIVKEVDVQGLNSL